MKSSPRLEELSSPDLLLLRWSPVGHGLPLFFSKSIPWKFERLLLMPHRSSAVAYNYGVSGPFWYASGATVQVLLFATLAIELKRKSPNAHTFLEVIKARYGVATHAVYITFGLITNVLVTAMLLTGGSAVVSDLTGVPTAAACFLLPIGVVLYTMFGGIKATFLTDYVHTVMIFSKPLNPSISPWYRSPVLRDITSASLRPFVVPQAQSRIRG